MNGEQAKAFLTSSDNPVGGWIGLNEQWSGWRLSEVKPNEIVLEADGQRQTDSGNEDGQPQGRVTIFL